MSVENIEKAKRVKILSDKHQCPVSAIVLSYITSAPFSSVAIIGPSKIEQLIDSLHNSDLTLDERERQFLETGEKEQL
jgi:aryl-alcohol dehydrogenase-like predicted oxidoreductase